MKAYRFYGHESATAKPKDALFSFVGDPCHLYDLLLSLWSADTCAPRLRQQWSKGNPTLGQCSITAFLVQDIFGGEVYGVPLGDGNYHCFNKVGDSVFDLTSEQFGKEKLDYGLDHPQAREIHFAKEEKRQRYLSLRNSLLSLSK